MPARQDGLERSRPVPVPAAPRPPRRRRGGQAPGGGRIIRRAAADIAPERSVSAPAAPAWPPGRIHELAKMRLIDLIALYQSMLAGQPAEHDQAARTAAGGWTKDQVITAIRNLEAPYQDVGGGQRAMEIIGSEPGGR